MQLLPTKFNLSLLNFEYLGMVIFSNRLYWKIEEGSDNTSLIIQSKVLVIVKFRLEIHVITEPKYLFELNCHFQECTSLRGRLCFSNEYIKVVSIWLWPSYQVNVSNIVLKLLAHFFKKAP